MPAPSHDRFDDVPDLARTGSHRAPRAHSRGAIAFAWAALATGVLVGAGVLGLSAIESRVSDLGSPSASTSASTAPKVVPTVDPKEDVVLLNATTASGLAASAEAVAKSHGWTVESVANADATNIPTTTVYYTDAGQAGAAAGLAKTLGVTRTAVSKQFAVAGQSRLTVVLGKDYAAKHA